MGDSSIFEEFSLNPGPFWINAVDRNIFNSRKKYQLKKKAYYLKNNLAYTEDHVLVKKLYLFHVAPQVN